MEVLGAKELKPFRHESMSTCVRKSQSTRTLSDVKSVENHGRNEDGREPTSYHPPTHLPWPITDHSNDLCDNWVSNRQVSKMWLPGLPRSPTWMCGLPLYHLLFLTLCLLSELFELVEEFKPCREFHLEHLTYSSYSRVEAENVSSAAVLQVCRVQTSKGQGMRF